jgi:alkylation response protein AidB-like acyl-CoA dehydrogenase
MSAIIEAKDYICTEEQAALRLRVRKFAEEVLASKAREIDEKGFDRAHYQKIMDSGLVGAPQSKADGGEGVGTVGRCIILEEISRVCPSTALSYLVGGMGLYASLGTDEQKQRYYYPWIAGKILPAFCLTELGAGSDVASVSTTAVREGDEYVLNGKKTLTTNGASADVWNVWAITNPEVPASKGMSAFIVEKGTPGVKTRVQKTMSLRGAEVAEIEFVNCRIPAKNLLGEEGKGFKYAMGGIAGGRINAAACSIGIAQHALEMAVAYAKARVQFKQPIGNNQGLSWELAEMKCKLESARALVMKAAAMIDAGLPEAGEFASMAKVEATEAAQFCADRNLQIHGGFGCTTECDAERVYRDAHAARIYDGTTDILKLVISRALLK